MEDRQSIEDLVAAVAGDARQGLSAIRENIPVRENDAFRQPFRAGREEDCSRRVIVDFDLRVAALRAKTFQFIEECNRWPNVFEIDDAGDAFDRLDESFEMSLFDEDARRQND